MSNVQEVFGQFAVEINGEVTMFATEQEAQAAFDANANSAGYLRLATAYTDHKGLIEKNAKGKINVITDFLAFAESYVPPVDGAEVAEEVAEVADTSGNDANTTF